MDWMEITVRTNTAGADMVSEQLMIIGAKGTVIEDRLDAVLDQEGLACWDVLDSSIVEAMDEDVLVRGYLPDDASSAERLDTLRQTLSSLTEARIGFDAGSLAIEVENVQEDDWAENWKKYYKPFRVGERIVIKPEWEHFLADPEDVVVEIDPGMAFGNGTHETTWMCLALLEELVRPGDRVLDVGTGSGILAIAAGKLGAEAVLGVDLDPLAVRVANENIARNRVEGKVTARLGDLLEGVTMEADVVIANIIADAVILLSGAVRRHIRPGGRFISSGIISGREEEVTKAILAAGFQIEKILRRGEWSAIVAGAEE